MNIVQLLEQDGFQVRRQSNQNGGSYTSACPFCGIGVDRLISWPKARNSDGAYKGGRFSCPRHCRKSGDAISYLVHYRGMKFPEACDYLKIEPSARDPLLQVKKTDHFLHSQLPNSIWIEKGNFFVDWCHQNLLKQPEAMKLVAMRGFTEETIKRFRIGFNPGDKGRDIFREREDWGLEPLRKEDGSFSKLWLPRGLVIPTLEDGNVIKIKIRRSSWKEGCTLPKYVELSGSKNCPSTYGDPTQTNCFVLESEFDAILLQQESSDLGFSVALGGASKSLDRQTYELLKTRETFFIPDFDQAGATAWVKWQQIFPNSKRILPPTEKSAGDYFKAGGNLRGMILKGMER